MFNTMGGKPLPIFIKKILNLSLIFLTVDKPSKKMHNSVQYNAKNYPTVSFLDKQCQWAMVNVKNRLNTML